MQYLLLTKRRSEECAMHFIQRSSEQLSFSIEYSIFAEKSAFVRIMSFFLPYKRVLCDIIDYLRQVFYLM